MTKLRFPKDARLPFPTRIIQLRNETIELYEIPYAKKATVLKALYPFIPKPSLDDEMYDIHADKKFIVKEFLVTREDGIQTRKKRIDHTSNGFNNRCPCPSSRLDVGNSRSSF